MSFPFINPFLLCADLLPTPTEKQMDMKQTILQTFAALENHNSGSNAVELHGGEGGPHPRDSCQTLHEPALLLVQEVIPLG